MKKLLLLVLCLAYSVKASEDEDSETSDRVGRLFAYYSTTSVTSLTTTTITGIMTCLSTAATSCLGRKKRMKFQVQDTGSLDDFEDFREDIDGSLSSDEDLDVERGARSADDTPVTIIEREGRKLTIWSTAFTTLTITSTSVLTLTTVTASALCIASGVTAGCFVG